MMIRAKNEVENKLIQEIKECKQKMKDYLTEQNMNTFVKGLHKGMELINLKEDYIVLKIPKKMLSKTIVIGDGCPAQNYDSCENVYEIEIGDMVEYILSELKKESEAKDDEKE